MEDCSSPKCHVVFKIIKWLFFFFKYSCLAVVNFISTQLKLFSTQLKKKCTYKKIRNKKRKKINKKTIGVVELHTCGGQTTLRCLGVVHPPPLVLEVVKWFSEVVQPPLFFCFS
jgi:hypothetical protein